MYRDGFSACVLLDGKVVKESGEQIVVPFESEYGLRLKNKYAEATAVDIYIDGQLVNEIGHILLAGNSSLDVDQWILKSGHAKKLLFTKLTNPKVDQPNDSENGRVEIRFYKPKANVKSVPTELVIKHEYYPHYPIWPGFDDYYWMRYRPIYTTLNNAGYTTTNNSDTFNCNLNSTFTSDMKIGCHINNAVHSFKPDNTIRSMSCSAEPGATVKGRDTAKKFNEVNMGFELQAEPTVITFKIMGDRFQKPVVTKEYCGECGYKKNGSDL